jgi:hypothetical protein
MLREAGDVLNRCTGWIRVYLDLDIEHFKLLCVLRPLTTRGLQCQGFSYLAVY